MSSKKDKPKPSAKTLRDRQGEKRPPCQAERKGLGQRGQGPAPDLCELYPPPVDAGGDVSEQPYRPGYARLAPAAAPPRYTAPCGAGPGTLALTFA